MIPDWLRRQLEAAGRWDADGYARTVRSRVCPSCGTRVLAGLDGERCALPVVVDPVELDAVAEVRALLAGRDTYTLTREGAHPVLNHRDQFRLSGRRRGPVYAAHACPTDEGNTR